MEVLAAIEQSAIARLLKTSSLAYPLVSAVHIAAIGTLFASVALMELRLMGRFAGLPAEAFFHLMQRVALYAFAAAAISGAALFSVRAAHYGALPVFLLKMSLIILAVGNAILVALLLRRGGIVQPGGVVKVSAAASMVLWAGVILSGRLIGFA